MMKAVVLHEADDMRVEQRPVPEPGPGEVLLKVNVTSICGTDVKVPHRKLLGQPDEPFIMGLEYAGTVAARGPGVDEFKVGERVAVEVHKGGEPLRGIREGLALDRPTEPGLLGPGGSPTSTATGPSSCGTRRPRWRPSGASGR
jgi:NADPH:quinone reductase-like Zn-dependent oxidoreductase